jgi:hypothetical protein
MPKFSDTQVASAVFARRAVHEYPFPASEGVNVGVRVLDETEVDAIRLEAARICKVKQVEAALDPEFFDRIVHRLVVLNAFFDVDDKQGKFFASYEEVSKIDTLLLRTLYELYCTHVQAMDPLAYCSAEEVEVLVEQLGKSEVAAARLSLFDKPTLVSFVLSLVHNLRSMSATSKSSTG